MTVERFPIEAGHILMFARAVGDHNGGVIPPPTFTMASAQFDPEYSLRPRPGEPWLGSGREPTGILAEADATDEGTGLHAEQHFTYHEPVRAGDVLSATTRPGDSWEKVGRRGGTLAFTEQLVEYRNQDGTLVVTARMVGVRTQHTPAREA